MLRVAIAVRLCNPNVVCDKTRVFATRVGIVVFRNMFNTLPLAGHIDSRGSFDVRR